MATGKGGYWEIRPRRGVALIGYLCHKGFKRDATIRNLDDEMYRSLRARAVLEGRTVGDLINEAIRAHLGHPGCEPQTATLRDLKPERFPKGNERLSEQIDAIVYGRQR